MKSYQTAVSLWRGKFAVRRSRSDPDQFRIHASIFAQFTAADLRTIIAELQETIDQGSYRPEEVFKIA